MDMFPEKYGMSYIRRKNSEYNECKKFYKNENEYTLTEYLDNKRNICSTLDEICELDKVYSYLESSLDIPYDIKEQTEYIGECYGIDYLGSLKVLLAAVCMATWGRLSVKPNELWLEPGILQTIMVGKSGTMKSPLLKAVAYPLRQFELDRVVPVEQRAHCEAMLQSGRELFREMEKIKLRESIMEAVHSAPETVMEKLKQLANESARRKIDAHKVLNFSVPNDPCLILDTATPLALINQLKQQGECACIMSGEPDFIKKIILDRSAEKNIVLRGANQEQYVKVSCHAKNDVRLRHPAINILVMSQHSIAEKLYCNEEMNDIGLTARLMPHFFAKYDHIDKYESCAVDKYNSRIRDLLDQYYTQDSNAERYTVKLKPGAVNVLDGFREEIVHILKVKDMPESAAPWMRKACGLALRYALAYHAWRCANPHESDITMDEMLLGVMVVRESLAHVKFAYSPKGLCAVNTARKIIDSIGNRPEDTYIKLNQVWTSTLIQQRIGRKSVEVNNALKLLEDLNWITLHDEGSNNLKFMLHRDFFRKALP